MRCIRTTNTGGVSTVPTLKLEFHRKEKDHGRRYRYKWVQLHRCRSGLYRLWAAQPYGVGHVVGNFLSGALRNPSAAAGQTATMFIGIAFAEALGIFSFLVALLLMFAV